MISGNPENCDHFSKNIGGYSFGYRDIVAGEARWLWQAPLFHFSANFEYLVSSVQCAYFHFTN